MKLYALFDKKADAYSSFHAEKSDAVATRSFAAAVLEPKSLLGQYADDFMLVRLVELPEASVDVLAERRIDECVWEHIVVISARQVLDMQPKAGPDGQLSLLKEA